MRMKNQKKTLWLFAVLYLIYCVIWCLFNESDLRYKTVQQVSAWWVNKSNNRMLIIARDFTLVLNGRDIMYNLASDFRLTTASEYLLRGRFHYDMPPYFDCLLLDKENSLAEPLFIQRIKWLNEEFLPSTEKSEEFYKAGFKEVYTESVFSVQRRVDLSGVRLNSNVVHKADYPVEINNSPVCIMEERALARRVVAFFFEPLLSIPFLLYTGGRYLYLAFLLLLSTLVSFL